MLCELMRGPMSRRRSEGLAIVQEQRRDICLAQARYVGEDRLVDRIKVGGRLRDDTQHFACGGLLLEGLREFAAALP